MPADSEKLLVDAAAAAELLSVSKRHFLSLDATGRLGPMKVRLGNRALWGVRELQAWTDAACPARDKWLSMKEGGK